MVHLAVAAEERRIREQRMAGVEQRELHVLESRHIIGELHTDILPAWASGSKVILDHPLDEVLGIDGALVVGAIALVQPFDVLGLRSRSDAVNHRVGEGHVLLHPLIERLVLGLKEGGKRAAGGITVMLQVIAREDGDGAGIGADTTAQALSHIAESGNRVLGVLQIVLHHIVVELELTRLAVLIVAALGDGHGDNLHRGVSNLVEDALGILDAPVQLHERADKPGLVATVATAYRQRIFAVLILQCGVEALVLRQYHRATDAPVALVVMVLKQQVGHILKMCAVEVAHTKMDDTRGYYLTIVGESVYVLVHNGFIKLGFGYYCAQI